MRLAPFARGVVAGLLLLAWFVATAPVADAWNPFARSSEERPAAQRGTRLYDAQGDGIAQQPQKRGPLFQGREIQLPQLPFGRSKPTMPNTQFHSQANNSQRPAMRAGEPVNSRFGTAPAAAKSDMPRPMAYAPLALPTKQRTDVAQRPMLSTPQAQPPAHERGGIAEQRRPTAPSGQPPRRGLVGSLPQSNEPHAPVIVHQLEPAAKNKLQPANGSASSPKPLPQPADEPTEQPAAATAVAAASVPTSPADRLLAQAHEWTAAAESEADYTRIIDACRRVRTNQPSPTAAKYASELASWAFNRRGQLKAEAGRDKEAIADFDDSIRADPDRWRPIHNRGVLLAQTGEFERAFDDFSRTIQLNPQFAKAYSNRAALLVVAGDLPTALVDYRKAVELDSKLAVAHRGLGRTCHLLGKLDEALTHYDEAVRLAPEDAYAVVSRADLLTDLGHYADALDEYERTIKLNAKSSHAYSSSAWLLATCPDASIRNAELAVERAKTAIELGGGKDAVAYDTLAAAHANAGDFSAALHTVRQAMLLAPPEERNVYEERLLNYQHARPYRIAPIGDVLQASYEAAE